MIKRILLALALTFASLGQSAAIAAPVINIDLSADAPVLTRTTSSGVTPVHWDSILGSHTYGGYKLQLQVASDVDFASILQDTKKDLTEADLASGATLDWTANTTTALTTIGATNYIRERVLTTTPLGTLMTSGWSTIISPTNFGGDAVTDNFDDNSLNTTLWLAGNNIPSNFTVNGATVAEASGTTLITPNITAASTAGRRSANAAAFTGKFAAIRLPADFDVAQQLIYIHVGPSAGQGYQLQVAGAGGSSSVHILGVNGGATSDISGSSPFFGTYRWIRLKDDGAGNILMQAAAGSAVPASGAWVTLYTFAYGGWPYGNLETGTNYVWIGGGNWGANASITPVAVDDFNTDMTL